MHRAVGVVVLAVLLLAGCSGAPRPAQSTPGGGAGPASPAPPSPAPTVLHVKISALSWQDNDPPGPATNDHPILHDTTGGQGSYADPISVSLPTGAERTYPPGTRFYLPSLRRYFIAEDYGQSAAPAGTDTLLVIWIDGRDATKAQTDACEAEVTGDGVAIADLNPPPNLPVTLGPIFANHTCNIPPPS